MSMSSAAVYCGPLPDIPNADVSVTLLTYMSTASVNCSRGFLFLESIRSVSVTCEAEGTWNATAKETTMNSHVNYDGTVWDIKDVNCSSIFNTLFTTLKRIILGLTHKHIFAQARAQAHTHTQTNMHAPKKIHQSLIYNYHYI